MVAFLRFVSWLMVRRARASWQVMLASAFGVLLAVTVVSVAVVHSRTLAEAGLRHTLATSSSPAALGLQLIVQDRPLGRQDYDRMRLSVEQAIEARLGWLRSGMHRFGRSLPLTFVDRVDAKPAVLGAPTAYVFFQDGFREHVRLVAGRWPQETPGTTDDGGLSLEVALGAEAARAVGWAEDSILFLVPFRTAPEEKVAITVVGLVEPTDPEEPYWFGDISKFRAGEENDVLVVPMYAGEDGFFGALGARYPMLLGTYWWYVGLDVGSLTAATASQARQSLVELESDTNRAFPRSLVLSALGGVIADYRNDLTLARVPLFLFTSLLIGLVLYYLVLITVMLTRDRGVEAAMIRSRGATVLQVGGLVGLGEGLAIALPSVLVGPFLGWAIASMLPTGDAGLGHLSVGLSPSLFVIAAAVGFACMAVFLASGLRAAGWSIVQFLRERARPPDRPAMYRYAIDLVVLAALVLVWWQIRGRGGFLTERLLGEGLEVDLSLLLGPALALLAVGLLLLRVLPFLLRLLARLADPFGAAWLVHAMKRMARDHLAYGTLAVLLMVATALGIFGATFGATLTRSQADQARYAIGGEMVVPPPPAEAYRPYSERGSTFAKIPGVSAVAQIHRTTMATAGGSSSGRGYSLLAVDAVNLSKVAWFREDFADKGMEELLRPLRRPLPVDRAIRLPEGTDGIGIWVRPESPYSGYSLYVRLRDAIGRYESVLLGRLGEVGWTYLEAPVPKDPRVQPPFSLVGINLSGGQFTGFQGGSVALDDVTAVVDGEQMVFHDFESVRPWTLLPTLAIAKDTLTYHADAAHAGSSGAVYAWTAPIRGGTRGLYVTPVPMPLPAISSTSFGPGQELVGSVAGQPVTLLVRDVAKHFPTLYPAEKPFLVVNLEHLERYLRFLSSGALLEPTEFWIGLTEGTDRAETVEALREELPSHARIRDREEQAEWAQANPLAGGAWNGLALLAAVTLGGVAILGFGLYAGLAVKRARVELGVLQALGLFRRQVGMVLALEGLVVAAVGLAVGVATGAWVGRWSLGYLDVTARGRAVVPPMDLILDWPLAALALAELVLAAIVAVTLALILTSRLRLRDVLRVEE